MPDRLQLGQVSEKNAWTDTYINAAYPDLLIAAIEPFAEPILQLSRQFEAEEIAPPLQTYLDENLSHA